jgi:hypothetical protein
MVGKFRKDRETGRPKNWSFSEASLVLDFERCATDPYESVYLLFLQIMGLETQTFVVDDELVATCSLSEGCVA